MRITERLRSGWNAFMGRDPTPSNVTHTYTTSYYPGGAMGTRFGERSIIDATINRIAVDVAQITVEHANIDDEKRYRSSVDSHLNECLTLAANDDQTGRAFMQDAAHSLLQEGVVAIVPTDATDNPMLTEAYDIGSLRVGKVVQWYPQEVKVELYNERIGKTEQRIYPKYMVALPENPFYTIMNQPNSTYRRLVEKLRQLDVIDRQSSSGKLDIIIQVPYSTKSKIHKEQAETRRQDIESQLAGSKYGVAYIDGTEKVIQLNRAIENNLFNQVEYYTKMFYSQLGLPMSVFDGTADEATMLNYQNRTLEPIISAIVDSMKWKFLSKSARTRGQSIVFFKDPFKMVPLSQIADIGDKLRRNEIATSNEIRSIIGMKPSEDERADMLENPNMPAKDENVPAKEVDAGGVPPDKVR